MANGDSGCPPGTEITSKAACSLALADLGLCHDKTWDGSHNGIPLYCSTRSGTGTDCAMHFNSASSGKGRADLMPVCASLTAPPPAPGSDAAVVIDSDP